ncbi:hypothetical protein GBAR_LOCUS23630 [Geodia barretti]|uniref:Uncharacterized protein n=1 Tax=Geodia barretti TaxID=519541 RepID=A0AA35X7M9_GEOBA|nr:hypothetical protein GBAR_LOCUS23630 [Geodia barretti]
MRSMEEKRLKREKLEEKERRRNDREMRRELKEKAMAEKMKGVAPVNRIATRSRCHCNTQPIIASSTVFWG